MSENVIIRPQEGAQEIALNSDANIIIFGGAAGSSKSFTGLMHPLQYINDPNFNGVCFRRVTRQLSGLWDESKKLYQHFKTRVREQALQHIFPSGAKLSFSHMEHTKNRFDHQGLQYSYVFFDELTHFEEVQFTYLLSRLRSDAQNDSYCFASCNPDCDSWVLKWVEWWLDEEGYPDPKKRGVKRFYTIIDDQPVFADSAEELKEKYPDFFRIYNPVTKDYVEIEPASITFIGGTIFDNPALIKKEPQYLAKLNALPRIEKARLLHGNWYAREEGSSYFVREWLPEVDSVPAGAIYCRGWDKAGSVPSETYRYPDYTASIKLAKDRDGIIYILGDFHQNAKDKGSDVYGRFRRLAGERDKLILEQSQLDGTDCIIVMAKDSGQAGQSEYQASAKKLMQEGFVVKPDPMANNKGKLTKGQPFTSACQNGLVRIVPSSFPNKATLDAFLGELEKFDGERSTATKKDDWWDSIATAFNYISRERNIPSFKLSDVGTKDNPYKINMRG